MKVSFVRGIMTVLLIILVAVLSGCGTQQTGGEQKATNEQAAETDIGNDSTIYTRGEVATAEEAKQLLADGNQRYVEGQVLGDDITAAKREDLVQNGQHPFATIVTCSDSRVAPEILFDQGLSDVFIIRTAGNVVDPIALGSVEYGVEHLHTPLLVVLGHSKCGAVKATVETVEQQGNMEGNIGAILNKIKPSVDQVKATGTEGDAVFDEVENQNVKAVMAEIEKSPVVKELVEHNKLKVVGAKYHLESGIVEFFE